MEKYFDLSMTCIKTLNQVILIMANNQHIFQCFTGVRQGENLSPILFAIFLNDLETFLENNNCKGVDISFRYEDLTLCLKNRPTLCGRYSNIWYM